MSPQKKCKKKIFQKMTLIWRLLLYDSQLLRSEDCTLCNIIQKSPLHEAATAPGISAFSIFNFFFLIFKLTSLETLKWNPRHLQEQDKPKYTDIHLKTLVLAGWQKLWAWNTCIVGTLAAVLQQRPVSWLRADAGRTGRFLTPYNQQTLILGPLLYQSVVLTQWPDPLVSHS